jgi:maleate isomerase
LDVNDSYGWRGRIGHVSPGLNDTQGLEFDRLLPAGVMVVTTTMTVQSLAAEEFEQSFSLMEQRALALAREEVGAIVIGGDPIFCLKGIGSHQKIIDAVHAKTGIPTSTTISVAMDALRSLNVKRVAVATPFALEKDESLRRYLDGSGFEVLAVKGLGITRNVDFTRLPFDASYRMAVEAFSMAKGAQGVYISCPRWPVVMNIGRLEKDLGVPVITSTQAMAWFGLKSLGIREQIKGYGTLLEGLAKA